MTVSLAEIVSLLDVSSVFLFLITVVVFSVPVFIIFPPLPVERADALQQTHSKVGVPERDSNLRDQWTMPAVASSQEERSRPTSLPRIQSLHIYPLKSCRGIELTEAAVLPTGLEHDRVFCLAQLKTKKASTSAVQQSISTSDNATATTASVDYWEVVTLRQVAHMAKISVDLWVPDPKKHSRQLGRMTGEGGDDISGCGSSGESFLVVRFPWRDAGIKGLVQTVAAKLSRGLSATAQREFMLSLSYPSTDDIKAQGYSYTEVTLFRNVIPALNMATDLPDEFSLYLGREPGKLALFRLDPAQRRQVFDCAPTKDAVGYQPEIDFQDAVRGNLPTQSLAYLSPLSI
ncbi:hypothetical protein NQ176_g3254 [Zarea fungicola]|uniref:Uncharacterized protein n=1 Tax=Zarea fungicola TaxID=93591 RepID=A0ACC1NKJ3_9HYPO|nr:hypothetical protein NQ176_g3254 [Lecanicillium fungicola]